MWQVDTKMGPKCPYFLVFTLIYGLLQWISGKEFAFHAGGVGSIPGFLSWKEYLYQLFELDTKFEKDSKKKKKTILVSWFEQVAS